MHMAPTHLVPQTSAAGVDHDTDLAHFCQAHHLRRLLVEDLVNHLKPEADLHMQFHKKKFSDV